MKKFPNRLIALALCFTLTLGAFVYRPPEAKAVAGVDDAIVIGALLSAFAGGCGLIFSNNGMSSNEIAQGLTAKWNDFKETLASVPATFSEWLGYDSMDALITDLHWDEVKDVLSVPLGAARKLADFTDWLTADVGVSEGGEEKPVLSSSTVKLYRMHEDSQLGLLTDSEIPVVLSSYTSRYEYSLGTPVFNIFDLPGSMDDALIIGFSTSPETYAKVYYSRSTKSYWGYSPAASSQWSCLSYNSIIKCLVDGNVYLGPYGNGTACDYGLFTVMKENVNGVIKTAFIDACAIFKASDVQPSTTNVSVGTPAGVQTPDLADDAETAPTPTITGVGWDAATIEELLQQILDQLQANTLATTISVDATQTGGETGTDTDEDAKPYLPFIPQIFEKVKEIPGTLSNIWDTVKQLPAAIAEKISAFFTTLWGWLQDIIDEIKALPAAIAEKVGALFTPDEALVTEITDTFKGKFGFLSTLKQFGDDLFGMTADSEPPVIWVHLENAESKFGYTYGDKQKILDFTWYQKYKANVDTLISGFLWLGFLWLLFKRVASIIQGGEMLTEYVHDFDQGRRDSNETKFQKWLWKD